MSLEAKTVYNPQIKIELTQAPYRKTFRDRIALYAPYHPRLPQLARLRGGKWDGSCWLFDPRDEAEVHTLAIKLFGSDGTGPVPVVTVRVTLDHPTDQIYYGSELWLLGRQLAYRSKRDYPVRFNDGVVVVSGGFHVHGGSTAHPDLAPFKTEPTILEVRDVPEPIAWREVADHPDAVAIVGENRVPALGIHQTTHQFIMLALNQRMETGWIDLHFATGATTPTLSVITLSISELVKLRAALDLKLQQVGEELLALALRHQEEDQSAHAAKETP